MTFIDNIHSWLQQLEPRERQLVLAGAILILVSGIYALVIEPTYTSHQALQQRVATKRELLTWMQQSAAALQQQRPEISISTNRGSLLANVDNAARAANLGTAIRRIEQDGDTRVRVSLEAASFENIVRWLGNLQHQYGVKPVQARIDRADNPGQVNATLTLASTG